MCNLVGQTAMCSLVGESSMCSLVGQSAINNNFWKGYSLKGFSSTKVVETSSLFGVVLLCGAVTSNISY